MSTPTIFRVIEPTGYGWKWRVVGGMDPFAIRSGSTWTHRRAVRDSALALAHIIDGEMAR